ncbi:MAG: hypothetical protein VX473_03605 [Candidatus Thermoplasmatota archaeon]|nr:hypothetical protein [Candidatus Thermoplasmatota archaeon]
MAARRSADEKAVSEIMGVTMLLAMVITTMAGVMVVMQPFMQDLTDNRDWAAGSVAATQFNDRLMVVADSPIGTGMVVTDQHISDTIKPLRMAENWQISADLSGDDRVTVLLQNGMIKVSSLNNTAESIQIMTSAGSEQYNLTDGSGELTANMSMQEWMRIDVLDSDGEIIHRWIQTPLDGVQIHTPLNQGSFVVNLINGARIEQLPNQPIDVRSYPRLHHDYTLEGGLRVSLVLIDVDIEGGGSSTGASLDLESRGEITFFDDSARNLKLVAEFTGEDNPESRYLRQWTDSFDLHRSTGDSSEYIGFGPNGRLSGAEGLTLHPTTSGFHLDVIMQQVVIQ